MCADQLHDMNNLMGSLREKYGHSALLSWDNEFVDSRDCSESYQQSFKDAWKVSLPIVIWVRL